MPSRDDKILQLRCLFLHLRLDFSCFGNIFDHLAAAHAGLDLAGRSAAVAGAQILALVATLGHSQSLTKKWLRFDFLLKRASGLLQHC